MPNMTLFLNLHCLSSCHSFLHHLFSATLSSVRLSLSIPSIDTLFVLGRDGSALDACGGEYMILDDVKMEGILRMDN
ncbi:hypothetical protein Lal_00021394, partial [Lupinus albus]